MEFANKEYNEITNLRNLLREGLAFADGSHEVALNAGPIEDYTKALDDYCRRVREALADAS